MHPSLNIDDATLARFCETHHIRRLSLFGSQLKGTAGPDSDIDLLVEFEPEHIPGLLGIAADGDRVVRACWARRSICARRETLSRYFRDEVVRTAEVQYAG